MTVSRRHAIGIGLAGSLAGLASACGQADFNVLRAADTHPSGYPTVEAVRYFAKLLADRTNGRLTTKIYAGGQLGQEKDTLEITIFGGLDFNRINLAPLNSVVAETIVPTLPFMFRSVAHMRAAMDGAPGDAILRSLTRHGLIGLCFYDSGARSFYTTKRPIHEPKDLRGMKIRVQNSDLYVSLVETLGGDAVPMPYGEVYQGLLQGVVDGAENNWPSFESSRHFEAANYYSLTRHVMAPEVLVMSARRWENFSTADQDIIRRAARDSVSVMRDLWDARVLRSKEIIEAAGIKLVEPDLAPFRDNVGAIWDQYLSSAPMRRLAEDIQSTEA